MYRDLRISLMADAEPMRAPSAPPRHHFRDPQPRDLLADIQEGVFQSGWCFWP